ncbi:unnamed protein product [Lymnaea stagnalis]|uniref:Uncharacterized protein n=1 Tax=Lymnaea stagnalis TaxID=6523 RepID=A0AAV2I8A4_LYMST
MSLCKASLGFSFIAALICRCVLAVPVLLDPNELPVWSWASDSGSGDESPVIITCGDKPPETDCFKCPECYDGKWECYSIDCVPVRGICVDSVRDPGKCCARCPNGPNCKINNQIVSVGQSIVMGNGGVCSCLSASSSEPSQTVCLPPSPRETTKKKPKTTPKEKSRKTPATTTRRTPTPKKPAETTRRPTPAATKRVPTTQKTPRRVRS